MSETKKSMTVEAGLEESTSWIEAFPLVQEKARNQYQVSMMNADTNVRRTCISTLCVDNLTEFGDILWAKKKISGKRNEMDDAIRIVAAVIDMLGNVDPECGEFMGRDVSRFAIPVQLLPLITPQKITLMGDGSIRENNLRVLFDDKFILAWGEVKSDIQYNDWLDACATLFGYLKREVTEKKMLSECIYSGTLTQQHAKAMTCSGNVAEVGLRPIPALMEIYAPKHMKHDAKVELCEVFRTCLDSITKN